MSPKERANSNRSMTFSGMQESSLGPNQNDDVTNQPIDEIAGEMETLTESSETMQTNPRRKQAIRVEDNIIRIKRNMKPQIRASYTDRMKQKMVLSSKYEKMFVTSELLSADRKNTGKKVDFVTDSNYQDQLQNYKTTTSGQIEHEFKQLDSLGPVSKQSTTNSVFEKDKDQIGSLMQIYSKSNKSALKKKQQKNFTNNNPDLNFGNSTAFSNMEDDELLKTTAPNTSVQLPLPENFSRMVDNYAQKAGSIDQPQIDYLQQSKIESGTLEQDELDQQVNTIKS